MEQLARPGTIGSKKLSRREFLLAGLGVAGVAALVTGSAAGAFADGDEHRELGHREHPEHKHREHEDRGHRQDPEHKHREHEDRGHREDPEHKHREHEDWERRGGKEHEHREHEGREHRTEPKKTKKRKKK